MATICGPTFENLPTDHTARAEVLNDAETPRIFYKMVEEILTLKIGRESEADRGSLTDRTRERRLRPAFEVETKKVIFVATNSDRPIKSLSSTN